MKVLFYCQHVLGIGHLVRSAEVARALSRDDDVTFVSGGAPVDGFPFPRGVKLVQLPALQTGDEFGALEDCGSGHTVEEVQALRVQRLLSLFDELRPDALVIELFPFGRKRFAFELIPLLERTRSRSEETLVACSLRDILVEKPDPAKHEERVSRIVNTYFDLILIHGDPAFQELDETFHRVGDLHCEIQYTGLVQQEEPALTPVPMQFDTVPTIVASIGSGRYRHGQILLESVIRAAAQLEDKIAHRFRVFAGPFIPPEVYAALEQMARQAPNVEIEKYSPHFIECLKRADLSISMGGYNTIMNILATGVRSLVYPYTANDDLEQQIRARKLASLGVAELLHPEMLAPEVLAPKIAGMLAKKPARFTFDMDGAANTARILRSAVSAKNERLSGVSR
ncbi:MAG TPA: glycosyltransferase [Bryobacteraceae bacterium]|nr:glycosyltransferase [Bryobacteraceae bacterium]